MYPIQYITKARATFPLDIMGEMPCFECRQMTTRCSTSVSAKTGCRKCAEYEFISRKPKAFWNPFSVAKADVLLYRTGVPFQG